MYRSRPHNVKASSRVPTHIYIYHSALRQYIHWDVPEHGRLSDAAGKQPPAAITTPSFSHVHSMMTISFLHSLFHRPHSHDPRCPMYIKRTFILRSRNTLAGRPLGIRCSHERLSTTRASPLSLGARNAPCMGKRPLGTATSILLELALGLALPAGPSSERGVTGAWSLA